MYKVSKIPSQSVNTYMTINWQIIYQRKTKKKLIVISI